MSSPINHGGNNLKAGDYKLEKLVLFSMVNGTEVPLDNIFSKMEIYEDIFSPYLTAKLFIEDSYNFPEKVPIVGQEKIHLKFKSDINAFPTVDLMFRVYKIDGHAIEQNGKAQKYTLHLMSEGGFFNFSEYGGYAVSGSVSDMVITVMKKHFSEYIWTEKLEVEPTTDNYSLVIPASYTPFKAIEWLCSRAHTTEGKEYSPFMFYETIDGYKFKSLSKIISDGCNSLSYYTYTQPNMSTIEGIKENVGTVLDVPNRYAKVQKLEELSRFDTVSNIMNGMISSRLVVHDLAKKEERVVEFFESEVFDSMKKLGEFPHFRQSDPDTHKMLKNGTTYFYLPSTSYSVKTPTNSITDNYKFESLYLKRKYHMNTFLTQKLAIGVFGDSRRRVGDVIQLDVFKPQSDGGAYQDNYDKNLSGQFLITTVKHSLGTSYTCTYELSRNSMGV